MIRSEVASAQLLTYTVPRAAYSRPGRPVHEDLEAEATGRLAGGGAGGEEDGSEQEEGARSLMTFSFSPWTPTAPPVPVRPSFSEGRREKRGHVLAELRELAHVEIHHVARLVLLRRDAGALLGREAHVRGV